jgi:hypothetical protein
MSSSTKIYLQRDFAAGVYLSKAQNLIHPPTTQYTYIQYTYSHREGGRVGELTQREGYRGTVHKDGPKIPT